VVMNQDEILTATVAQTCVSDVLSDYSWLWQDEGLTVPIQPDLAAWIENCAAGWRHG
jgi:hypothetical protein